MTATDLAARPLGGTRVLVAVGGPDDSVALTAVLRLAGFDAREARTAADALDAVADSRPAVVVIDLDLPDGNGCEFIELVWW
jgi:DNA-binding response OmpR family regulator